jgi:hypothetical protein
MPVGSSVIISWPLSRLGRIDTHYPYDLPESIQSSRELIFLYALAARGGTCIDRIILPYWAHFVPPR